MDWSAKAAEIAGMLIKAGLILVIGMIVIKIVLAIAKKALVNTKLDPSAHSFILSALKFIMWTFIVIMILQQLGVSTASLVTVLGGAAAAVALGLQNSMSNVASGLVTMVNKPFIKGDEVEIKGTVNAVGIVDEVGPMVTKLHTYDNKVMSIPNSLLTSSVLLNYTQAGLRRVDKTFSVSQDADIDHVKDVIRGVIKDEPIFKDDPEPIIGISSHGDSAVMYDVKAWCDSAEYLTAVYRLEEGIEKAFRSAGIEVPYPQMDVHSK
ncbi:MAG: mechanosensitive ion channel family protein [Eubacterium sp.]